MRITIRCRAKGADGVLVPLVRHNVAQYDGESELSDQMIADAQRGLVLRTQAQMREAYAVKAGLKAHKTASPVTDAEEV